MNVLVTGSSGQLALTIKSLFEINTSGINFIFKSRSELDITNISDINEFFSQNSLDYCINCAAFTNVELAETKKEEAFIVNSDAVKNLALICKRQGVVLIHISTDYVFDGESSKPYLETDPTNPINVYGGSKLEGERHIIANLEQYFIIRASWLYSIFGHNFFKTVVKRIIDCDTMSVVNSQIGTPTSCEDLAGFIYFLIKSRNQDYGLYHFAPNGDTSWYGFALYIANHYKSNLIYPVEFFNTKAKRPNYSVLNNSKVKAIGANIRDWRNGLDDIIHKYNKNIS
jgi:dTDP-4-dehydrorhamnose reductase